MELSDYLRVLRKNWILITAAILIGVAIGAVITLIGPKTYVAGTRLFVSVQSAESNSAGDAVQGSSAAQQKVKSYVDVVTSARVLSPVIESLDLDLDLRQLAAVVKASSPANSVLIDIAVTDADPDRAAGIANAIGASLTRTVVDLESPLAGGTSLVKLESIEQASAPATAASPRVGVNLALGVLGGLLLGIVAAALRTALDTRIQGMQDVEHLTGGVVLGGTSFDPDHERRPLVVRMDPRSPRAEVYRALRTNLQFIGLDAAARTFMVTSAVPGEGKTTTTANLAIAIAENGASVILIDGDLRRSKAAEIMGLDGAVGLTDVLIGRAELDDAIQPWGRTKLSVLPAGTIPPNPSELLGSAAMRAVIEHLATRFDYVLLDAPPVLPVTDAAVLSSVVSGVLVVTAARRTTRAQLRAALAGLERVDANVLGVIVTMLPTKGADAYGYTAYGTYSGEEPAVSAARTRRDGKRAARTTAAADVRS